MPVRNPACHSRMQSVGCFFERSRENFSKVCGTCTAVLQPSGKRCLGCDMVYERQYFPPLTSQPDGLHALCWGCRAEDNERRCPRTPR